MKRFVASVMFCGLPVAAVHALDAFVVKDIRVEGLQRTAAGTVFNYLPIKVGDRVTEDSTRDAIRALFKTGFFQDVKLERQGDVLVVIVAERPSIDTIRISGTHEIDEETLKKGLKDAGLAEGRVLDSATLDRMEQELRRQYFGRGYYGVRVKTTVTPLERNRVAVKIDVSEGRIARIRQISIVGNHAFSDKQVLGNFTLRSSGWFTGITKSDQYSKPELAGDLEKLRSFYQNQGYLEFSIDSTQVSITPDREQIYITINITEGRSYKVGEIKLAGKLVVPEAELRQLISIKPGDVFSRQEMTETTKRLSDRLGDDGYAFANVNAVPDVDREAGTAAFTLYIDPGQRVYVRRINFSGNSSTRDEVLRREMRQFEGGWFSAGKVQRSRERLQRLGFFDDVNIETPAIPGVPDMVDVNITVKERAVNTFMASIGYSDQDGALLSGNLSFKNLMGTGKEASLSIDTSHVNKHVNLGYTNPYYTDDGISRSFNLYSTKTDAAAANTAAYNTTTHGLGVSYGIPISESRSITAGLAYESIALDVTTSSAKVAQDFVAIYGDTNAVVSATLGIALDTLDNPILPSRGTVQRISLEATVPGSELEYFRLNYTAIGYLPLSRKVSLKGRTDVGYGDGYGDTQDLPFYKNYFAGGSSSVRGYRARSLGPKDIGGPDETLPIGGSKRLLVNGELLFPVPGAAPDNKSMRLSVFTDGGMVYGADQPFDTGELRYSAGLAFNWYSPVGPLSISYAKPLNDQPGDRTEAIQFTLGTAFR